MAKKRAKKESKADLRRESKKMRRLRQMSTTDVIGTTTTAAVAGPVGGSFEGDTPYVRLLLIDSRPPQPDTSGAVGVGVAYTLAASAPHMITVSASAQPTVVLTRASDGQQTTLTPTRRGTSNIYDVTIAANTMTAGTAFNPSYYLLTFTVSTAICEIFLNVT